MTELSDMGYAAQLIARLLEVAGPLTLEQINRWVVSEKDSGITNEVILDQMIGANLVVKGDAGLYRFIGDASCECGGGQWDHKRLVNARRRELQARQQLANMTAVANTQIDTQEMPLRRRIIMQRREIHAAWASSAMYQRMWRRERDKNNV